MTNTIEAPEATQEQAPETGVSLIALIAVMGNLLFLASVAIPVFLRVEEVEVPAWVSGVAAGTGTAGFLFAVGGATLGLMLHFNKYVSPWAALLLFVGTPVLAVVVGISVGHQTPVSTPEAPASTVAPAPSFEDSFIARPF